MNLQENIRRILKEEMDDFDWIRDIKPTPDSTENIKHILNKPFKIYDRETGKEQLSVAYGIYWIEEHEKSPKKYNVCWDEEIGSKTKGCVDYIAYEIIEYFSEVSDYRWLWKFVD
jgi:hypothetical protein